MRRLNDAMVWMLMGCFVGMLVVSVILIVNRNALRRVYSTRPTATNTTRFTTSDGHRHYAPAHLVVRRRMLDVAFVTLVLLTVCLAVTLNLLQAIERGQRRSALLQARAAAEAGSDFQVDEGGLSWTIPRCVNTAVVRSPRTWLRWLLMMAIVGIVLDVVFRLDPKPNPSPPDLVALQCAAAVALLYPVMVWTLLKWRSLVTLDEQGITVQIAGKGGRRSTCPYSSVAACWIESSRWVPSLPCLAFTAPGRLRAEKTRRVEMPADADLPAVIRYLAAKGIVCPDRRSSCPVARSAGQCP